jgi:hypothetical protein
MFVKIFSQIFDSSIAEDYLVRFVFGDFLILADKDGHVDMTPGAISRRTNVPLEIVNRAIEKLSAPDRDSRSPDEEGRRIVLIDPHRAWGWRIVNYEHYRGIRDDEARKEYFREQKREQRAKSKNVQDSQGLSTIVTQAEAEAEATTPTPSQGSLTIDPPEVPRRNVKAETVNRAWDYFKATFNRNGNYGFSATRRKHGEKAFDALKRRCRQLGIPEELHEETILQWFAKAIDRLEESPFHRGQNERRKCYQDWENLFRSRDHRSPDHLTDYWLDDSKFKDGRE